MGAVRDYAQALDQADQRRRGRHVGVKDADPTVFEAPEWFASIDEVLAADWLVD